MKNRFIKSVIIGMMLVTAFFYILHINYMACSASNLHNQKMMRLLTLHSKEVDLALEEAHHTDIINYDNLNLALTQYKDFVSTLQSDPELRPFFKEILSLSESKLEAIEILKHSNLLMHNAVNYINSYIHQTLMVKDTDLFTKEQRQEITNFLEAVQTFGSGAYALADEIDNRAKAINTFPDIAKTQELKEQCQKHLSIVLAEGKRLDQAIKTIHAINERSAHIVETGINELDENELAVDNTFSTIVQMTLLFIFILLIVFYLLINRLLKQGEQTKAEIRNATADLINKNRLLEEYQSTIDKHVIFSRTDIKGRITYASKAFCDISGYTKEELLSVQHNIVRHPDMPKELYADLWKTILSGEIWQGEIKNLRKDGSFYWVDVTISPEFDEKGSIIGYNAIRHDISAKKELEKLTNTLEQRVVQEVIKNKQTTAQMIQQSRLAQMGEMISMIAHQWRQPLASISAISGTLSLDVMMENYKQEFFKERLEAINHLSQHLSSTIDDFREFFKDTKQKTPCSCTEMVESSLKIIESTLESKSITIYKEYEGDIMVPTYPNEIKQVILNILKNAEDILLEKQILNPAIWITTHCLQESYAVITIEDNAGGVPTKLLEKIFDPYFSTKTKKDGTGLGLYMSKTIIEEHCSGTMRVINTDRGAKFEITLRKEKETT